MSGGEESAIRHFLPVCTRCMTTHGRTDCDEPSLLLMHARHRRTTSSMYAVACMHSHNYQKTDKTQGWRKKGDRHVTNPPTVSPSLQHPKLTSTEQQRPSCRCVCVCVQPMQQLP